MISLVELGVIRDVDVDGDRVRVEFTPTFLGCPALDVMRDAMAEKVRELGAEPDVAVITDDSGWAATCWVSRRSTRRRSRSLAARARTWGSFRGSKASACRLAFA